MFRGGVLALKSPRSAVTGPQPVFEPGAHLVWISRPGTITTMPDHPAWSPDRIASGSAAQISYETVAHQEWDGGPRGTSGRRTPCTYSRPH
jgi:hypothetical protein